MQCPLLTTTSWGDSEATCTVVLVGSHGEKDGSNDGTVVDFRGNPVDKSKTGGWLAAGLILGAYDELHKLE
ncbi:hypothetical protein QQP08_000502 [Theobroma cacao]|nr:hypothetical protein QQP08_000502 [Theobroma cacao]